MIKLALLQQTTKENEMTTSAESMSNDVTKELEEMKKIGMRVKASTLKAAKNPAIISEYLHMSVSDLADLLRDCY